MIDEAFHSMAYSEAGSASEGCELYFPGSPVETFTMEALGVYSAFNSNATTQIGTITPTAISGRNITWSGRFTNGAAVNVRVDQTFSYQTTDRHATMTIRLTNEGSAISDLYYLRNGDPDHGYCGATPDFFTMNDVQRQPPSSTDALITATSQGAVPT